MVLSEDLPLRELLAVLLGPEGKRKLMLRHKTNGELFELYDSDLVVRIHNARNLKGTRQFLAKFKDYLNGFPPSPELAKGFLAQYVNKKPHTFYDYVGMIKSLMKWYGEPLDLKVKVPMLLPAYTEDADIEKLFKVIEGKRTHKKTIVRDSLLVALDLKTGLRRTELTNLEPRDIHPDFLLVRNGKGAKDRIVPLSPVIATRLHNFTRDMAPTEKVFKLKPASLTVKIKVFAKKAGLSNLHTHSLRHKCAQDLLEAGADVKVVQQLLGHSNLATTSVYLSTTDKRMREAVALLDDDYPQSKLATRGMPWMPSTRKVSAGTLMSPSSFSCFEMEDK
jgi:integrase/recombinase XerD